MATTQRPTVKQILEGHDLKESMKKQGKSDNEIAGLLAPLVDDLSKEAFYVSMKTGEALGQTLKLASKKKAERTFNGRYGSVVLAVVLALKNAGRRIQTVMDVPKGAFIEVEMATDVFSLGGMMMIDVLDSGPDRTQVLGATEIKGQMFDWGKGARQLNDLFDRVEQYLRRLE